ncbi:hypothetical protein FXO37_07755 [Capsicum annuum]|nr:hypothetical protein FXO37_07755 [Capsicum annuum]
MDKLLSKIKFQGWPLLFIQGETQHKFGRPEVYEFYTNSIAKGNLLTTSMCGVFIHLLAEDIAHIIDIPLGGWDHYVKFEWPSLGNMASTLTITRNSLGIPIRFNTDVCLNEKYLFSTKSTLMWSIK